MVLAARWLTKAARINARESSGEPRILEDEGKNFFFDKIFNDYQCNCKPVTQVPDPPICSTCKVVITNVIKAELVQSKLSYNINIMTNRLIAGKCIGV